MSTDVDKRISSQIANEFQSGAGPGLEQWNVEPLGRRRVRRRHLFLVSGVMMLDGRINWSIGLETVFGR